MPRDPVKVSFTVERALAGMPAASKNVDVFTGTGGGDCGYRFERGVRYIVYAYKEPDGRLGTGTCSRTKILADAGEDLTYFDALTSSKPLARVFGFAFDSQLPWVQVAHGRFEPAGLKGVVVTIKGGKRAHEYKTGADGRCEFRDLEPGTYAADASLTGYVAPSLPKPVSIPAKGCAEFYAELVQQKAVTPLVHQRADDRP